jgi:hypothetical protein
MVMSGTEAGVRGVPPLPEHPKTPRTISATAVAERNLPRISLASRKNKDASFALMWRGRYRMTLFQIEGEFTNQVMGRIGPARCRRYSQLEAGATIASRRYEWGLK